MLVGGIGTVQKISDSTKRHTYDNLQKTNTRDDIKTYKLPNTLTITSDQLSKVLDHDNTSLKSQREINAISEYSEVAFPLPNYETSPDFYTKMVQERIRTSLHPGQHFPTGIEEYPFSVIQAQGTAALCATGTISQLKTTNSRSSLMWKFFGMTGKNTWNLEQLLSQHGWSSIIETKDELSYYKDRKVTEHRLPEHYNHLLSQADNIPANTILTARYADSRKLHDAIEANKNATHSLRSLGQITQDLSFEQLGLQGDNLENFKNATALEKKVILIYHLLYQRQIKQGMCGGFSTQSDRIRSLLSSYPDLLKVTQDNDIAHFHGTMVDHVYPIGQTPTNFVHYLFEMIAYQGGNKDGSKFLICDVIKPGPEALKYNTYNTISPLYKQIETIRHPFMDQKFIGSTYIVNFDDIDLNHNKKIDKTDKTIHKVLDEIVTTRYKNHGKLQGMTETQTKSYITKHLIILGAMDRFPTGTMIPLPLLTPENRKLIDQAYDKYTEIFNTFRESSRDKYFDHLENDIVPHLTTHTISTKGSMIYPVCFGDDNITIAQKICQWIDNIAQHNKDIHLGIALGNLTREEYNIIHTIISPYIDYKDTKTVQPGQTITIDIAKILSSSQFQVYIREQKKLATNYLPPIDHSVLGRFDDLMKILDIDESNRAIIQHYILRETGGEISGRDMAKLRSRSKMIAEQGDFDDKLGGIKEVSSQGALQMRIKYFIKGDNSQIGWIIQSSQDLLQNQNLNLTEDQKKELQEIITIAQPLLIQKNRQRAIHDQIKEYKDLSKDDENNTLTTQHTQNNIVIESGEKELLHLLSDIINFTSGSLKDPEQDLGTLLSIKFTSYQINKYKSSYTRELLSYLHVPSLSIDEIAFIQEFSYIANHTGTPLNTKYRNEIITFYDHKKQKNPDYKMIELHDEVALQHIYNYVNTLPPHSDIPSASIWSIITILGVLGLYKTNKKN